MIKIRIEASKRLPRKILTCPKCGYEEVFYNYPPWECERCKQKLGRIERLLFDISVRKYYSRKGEID